MGLGPPLPPLPEPAPIAAPPPPAPLPAPAPGSAVLGGGANPRPGDAVLGGNNPPSPPKIPQAPAPPDLPDLPRVPNPDPPKEAEPSRSTVKPSDLPGLISELGPDADLRNLAGLPPAPPIPPPGDEEKKNKPPDYPNEYGLLNGKYRILGRFTQRVTYFLSYDKSTSISINRYFWCLEADARTVVGRFLGVLPGKKSAGVFIDKLLRS